MDWLKGLLEKAGIEEAKRDGLIADICKELPKHSSRRTSTTKWQRQRRS